MAACNSPLETNVVVRAEPFQFTTAFDANPVPRTVSVNAPDAGAALKGDSGWLTSGTGFVCALARVAKTKMRAIAWPGFMEFS
jgi:hypothetical protein